MRLTLESTSEIVELSGVATRVWEGTTESGIKVFAFIVRVSADGKGLAPEARARQAAEFERELSEQRPPTVVWPRAWL
jgi:hypothetical protein